MFGLLKKCLYPVCNILVRIGHSVLRVHLATRLLAGLGRFISLYQTAVPVFMKLGRFLPHDMIESVGKFVNHNFLAMLRIEDRIVHLGRS